MRLPEWKEFVACWEDLRAKKQKREESLCAISSGKQGFWNEESNKAYGTRILMIDSHAFQKKSRIGARTPKAEIDLIHRNNYNRA